MAEHNELPFDLLHKAKFSVGLAADLPGAAEGPGDAYLQTDTGILSVCLSGTAWTNFSPGGSYEGTRWYLGSDSAVTGDSVANFIHWDNAHWSYGGTFGSPGDLILTPDIGMWQWTAHLIIDNSGPANWIFNVWSDDFTILQTHLVTADGSGDALELNISGESLSSIQQPTTGAWFYVDATQDSGGDLNIVTGSSITYSFMGMHP